MGSCAIATPHALATQAGADAARAGGSAVDAALAAAATVAVAYPHMNAIGGDVIALVRRPDGTMLAVNGSGAAAAACDPDRLRRAGSEMPVVGPETVTVPGAVAAWATLHELGGRLPWNRLLAPAVTAARDGVPVAPSLARSIAEQPRALAEDPGLGALLFAGGVPLRAGDALRQPALARTLEAIADGGAAVFYDGEVGAAFVRGMRAAGSALSAEDLREHRTDVSAPIVGRLGDDEIATAPPNAQGHVLLEALAALDLLDDVPDPLGAGAAVVAEVLRLATEDRDRYLADPRVAPVPLDELLSAEHAQRLHDLALANVAAGRAGGVTAGTPEPRPSGDTIAIVAADDEGWAVSLIQSVFHAFGARVLEPETGILCHNRGAFFSLDPASPNALAPRKRPAHTLMPVLVTRAGELVGAHGTMGGKAQPQIHAHLLLRLRHGADAGGAVGAPRWVVGALDAGQRTDAVSVEAPALPAVEPVLRAAGMHVRELPPLDESVGHAQLVRRLPDGGFDAASDPRADGAAAIVER